MILILGFVLAPAAAHFQGQLTEMEKLEVSLQAMSFLKASDITQAWRAAFRGASRGDVVAFLRVSERSAARAAQLRVTTDSFAFSLAPDNWSCGPGSVAESERADCALARNGFFADVGEPAVRGDTVYVVISLYAKEGARLTGVKTLVQVARVSNLWRGVRAFLFRE